MFRVIELVVPQHGAQMNTKVAARFQEYMWLMEAIVVPVQHHLCRTKTGVHGLVPILDIKMQLLQNVMVQDGFRHKCCHN